MLILDLCSICNEHFYYGRQDYHLINNKGVTICEDCYEKEFLKKVRNKKINRIFLLK
jgi:hypothetical protein